ncbi:polycystin-2-like [Cochliomyia hominivorax]
MKITKRTLLVLSITGVIMITCLIIITVFSGFRYEYKKFKQFVLTLIAIFLIRYIILDHIAFTIQALISTLKGSNDIRVYQTLDDLEEPENNPIDYLKLKLESSKSEFNLPQQHKDEALNLKYRELTEEFWLFGKYFFLLLLVIIYSRNSYSYYNTAIMRRVLNESYFTYYKWERVVTINDLYNWINDTLITSLHDGIDYDGRPIEEPGWINFHLAKLLGVVRLQQVRHAKKENSMLRVFYDNQNYFPKWQRLNASLPYMDKYWRTYYPWLSKYYAGISNWLMSVLYIDSLFGYTENRGYVAILTRDRNNSGKVLKFLKESNWMDKQTAALFIDFTLYNADSNIFTIISLLVEQTPFGNLVWHIDVQSAELLWNMNEISMWWWFLIILYTLQMIQFSKKMIVRSWFGQGFFKSRWNYVDLAMILLNILLLIFTITREYYVIYVMKTFVLSKKLEYVDFRVASVFDFMVTIILGVLICLASVRIWKILQFSTIFRIFNRTLHTSALPLFFTILGISIFLCATSLTAQILNGNHEEIFSRYLKSVTSIMSFSFGFNSRTNPDDLTHGGGILGFILYLILMFIVAIFLINMFITLICDHFSNAREERDLESAEKLSYWEFLCMEYAFIYRYIYEIRQWFSKDHDESVKKNINRKLDELEKKLENRKENSKEHNLTEDQLLEEEKLRVKRLENVITILNLQLEILDRVITVQAVDWDSDNENSD